MEEDAKIYLNSDRVLVTSAEAILAGKAYKIEDVESASSTIFSHSILEAIIYAVVGVIILLIGLFGSMQLFTVLGILLLCMSVIKLIISLVKPVYTIKLAGSLGNKSVFSSDDKKLIENIVGAINQAVLDKFNR